MASAAEQARDDIVAEFSNISTANGFRTNPVIRKVIRVPDTVTATSPEIGVELGVSTLKALDSNWTAFDEVVDVFIQGVTAADTDTGDDPDNITGAMEALLHDMRRIVASLYAQWLHRADREWNISEREKPVQFFRMVFPGMKTNRAVVSCSFKIKCRSMSEQLQKPDAAQVGDLALEQGGDVLLETQQNVLTEGTVS